MAQENFHYKGGSPDPYYPEGTEPTCGVGAQGYDCYNRGQGGASDEGLDVLDIIGIGGIAVVVGILMYAGYAHATKGLKFSK